MKSNLKKRDLLLSCFPAVFYLILSTLMWTMTPQVSIAQTSTDQPIQNQTAQGTLTNQTAQNQTVFQRGNVTQEDFAPIEDDLFAARDALHGNFNQTAFNLLSEVNNELYRMVRLAGPEGAAIIIEVQPIQNFIDGAQDALRNNDNLKTLQELNSADSEVLKLKQQASPTEETPE